MKACSLCAHLNALEVLFDDGRVAVVLHEDWAVRGHVMVVWKEHVENVSDLDETEAAHLARVYRHTERALLDVTQADRAIILKLGIVTPHLHLHIYPVSAALNRAEVMEIIDACRKEDRDPKFIATLRDRLDMILATE